MLANHNDPNDDDDYGPWEASFEPQHGFHTDRVGPVTRTQPTLKAWSTLEMRNGAHTAATAWFLFARRFYVNVVMIA